MDQWWRFSMFTLSIVNTTLNQSAFTFHKCYIYYNFLYIQFNFSVSWLSQSLIFLYLDWRKAYHVLVRKTSCLTITLATRQLVNNKTFIDGSTLEWVKCAYVSTVKFQSSFTFHIFSVFPRAMAWTVDSNNRWI